MFAPRCGIHRPDTGRKFIKGQDVTSLPSFRRARLGIGYVPQGRDIFPHMTVRDNMAIGSTRPLEDAARIAYRELIRWMVAEYGFEQWDAYMMLSQCGRVRLGNFVDPKYTVGAAVPKKYLA